MPTGSPTSAIGNQEGADPPLGRGETLPLPLAEYAQVVECRLERGVALEPRLPRDLPPPSCRTGSCPFIWFMYAMPTATAPACKTRFAAPTEVSPACLTLAIALNMPSAPRLESRCPLMPVSATFALLSVQRIPRIALATDPIRQRGPKTRIARDARINCQRNQAKSSARFTHGNRQSGEKPPPSLVPKG